MINRLNDILESEGENLYSLLFYVILRIIQKKDSFCIFTNLLKNKKVAIFKFIPKLIKTNLFHLFHKFIPRTCKILQDGISGKIEHERLNGSFKYL
jgi:hypothetical protein